jgi:dihydrofolate synthase/folylpolyglutamate synthase
MSYTYHQAVSYLEGLQIMPKSMPGLEKIKLALAHTDWYEGVNPNKVVVVSGTNGKGTTCAALESLLLDAQQKVGFYSSPHLVSTTERIRLNGASITEAEFVKVFEQCLILIKKFELSHFEALTLMAGHYFFSSVWGQHLDFAIFEVGLGGTFDATNAFPHKFCGVTKLGLDHVNILGDNIVEIAKNKFGIVGKKNIVVHHKLPQEVIELKQQVQKLTNSNWVEAENYDLEIKAGAIAPEYFLNYNNRRFPINIVGSRAAENIMTAISLFQVLGFDSDEHYKALNNIKWQGRMQSLKLADFKCPVYLSGDHNEQGVESLINILNDFKWKKLHLVVGIGADKDSSSMLRKLSLLRDLQLYLTETPFKGLKLEDYPQEYLKLSVAQEKDLQKLLNLVAQKASDGDLVLVTGSLYLVGEVIKTQLTRKIGS